MSAAGWAELDQALGYAELVAVPAAVGLLALAAVRPKRVRPRRALIAAIVVGATLAQPFGVRATPLERQQFYEPGMRRVDAQAVHSIDVLGVPIVGFRPYTRPIFYINGESGYPTHWLKVRTWVWPVLLTNATKLVRLCGVISDPCWKPTGEQGYGRSEDLQLWRTREGEWRYRVLTIADSAPPGGPPPPTQETFYAYRLTLGLASPAGLIYWLIVLGLSLAPRLSASQRQAP